MSMIVVVSDVHLVESRPANWPQNWKKSFIDDCMFSKFSEDQCKSLRDDCVFLKFLYYLAENQLKYGGELVLLGDFIDLWRSDFVQISQDPIVNEIISTLRKLVDKNVLIHCIAGNHDYGLLKFNEFLQTKNPFGNAVRSFRHPMGVFFSHGYQLEVLTWEVYKAIDLYEWFAEKFCLTDATIGADASKFWEHIHPQLKLNSSKSMDALGGVKFGMPELHFEWGNKLGSNLKDMGTSPEQRLWKKDEISEKIKSLAESNARCLYPGMGGMEMGDVLVFGHTHTPYYDPDHGVVNTGSWNKRPCKSYRFVEIDRENGLKIICKNFDASKVRSMPADC